MMSEGESIMQERLENILRHLDALIQLAKSFTFYAEKNASAASEPSHAAEQATTHREPPRAGQVTENG
jgi:hypothetical protein